MKLTSLLIAWCLCMAWMAIAGASQLTPTQSGHAEQISNMVATQEWLGPVSAVALSPFFGLACLSGIATYGPDWLRTSSLLGAAGPLNNPALFWTMASLTIATSLPRWTKFSKPIALGLEKFEAYSAIVILLVMKFTHSPDSSPSDLALLVATPDSLLRAGIGSMPLEVLVAVAMAINMIVVNTIKLLLDVLIWLIPVPAIDAVLELVGKAVCTAMLTFYAWNPTLATILNLTVFAICFVLFFSARRRLAYFKEILVAPILEKFFPPMLSDDAFHAVFLSNAWNGFPAWTRCSLRLQPNGNAPELLVQGWVSQIRCTIHPSGLQPEPGFFADTVSFGTEKGPVRLSARKGVFVPTDSANASPSPAVS